MQEVKAPEDEIAAKEPEPLKDPQEDTVKARAHNRLNNTLNLRSLCL